MKRIGRDMYWFKLCAAVFVAMATVAVGTRAEEAATVVERGTEGLDPVPFRIENRTDAGLACGASIAHWYSTEIGQAPPRGTVTTTFWSDRASGTVFVLNEHEDRMPVLAVWCGEAGADVTTGHPIRLQRRAGSAEPAIALVCTRENAKPLDCRPVDGP
jgi:hypothetical protein